MGAGKGVVTTRGVVARGPRPVATFVLGLDVADRPWPLGTLVPGLAVPGRPRPLGTLVLGLAVPGRPQPLGAPMLGLAVPGRPRPLPALLLGLAVSRKARVSVLTDAALVLGVAVAADSVSWPLFGWPSAAGPPPSPATLFRTRRTWL